MSSINKYQGHGGISAEIVAHSYSFQNPKSQIITFVLEYPRFIHGELMTHRLFSRNAASSRAIPVNKMIELIDSSAATPIHWGKNQAGMQAKEELAGDELYEAKHTWIQAKENAIASASYMAHIGAHKQIVNRILEPFQMMRTIVTATEWDNFFWLRRHEDAQPEIKELAECMWQSLQSSKPQVLGEYEWHVPFVHTERDLNGKLRYYSHNGTDMFGEKPVEIDFKTALKISASCCAQVSYRKLDDSLEKAEDIYKKLIESKPCHASPTEHQASPMPYGVDFRTKGVTHKDRDGNYWSGNFKGWTQHRQRIPENACWEYQS